MTDSNTPIIKIDRATKGLLVVIAFFLGVIAVGQMSNTAEAQGEGCGSASNPCYVKVLNY